MQFMNNGMVYEIVFVTDVISNGYGLEMTEIKNNGEELLVMTAFRPFGTQSIRISMHVQHLGYEVVNQFLEAVKTSLVDLVESPDVEREI